MLTPAIKALIVKDISLFKNTMWLSILVGLLAIGIFNIPGYAMVIFGSILLFTTIIAFYVHLVMMCICFERKEKNVLFVMTLPVSTRGYVLSKILSCSAIFFTIWSVLLISFCTSIALTGHLPGFMISYNLVWFGLFVVAFFIILYTAIVTESEGWTIVIFVITNIILTLLINIAPDLPIFQQGFEMGSFSDVGIVWLPIINTVLLLEVLCSIVLIGMLALALQRKTQFINA